MKTEDLFSLENTIGAALFKDKEHPWEVILHIKDFVRAAGEKLDRKKYREISHEVWVSCDAHVSKSAHIEGPTIIDEYAEVRPFAYIRGGAIIGKKCVVGNSTEVKNSIIFDEAQIPHYNYVGDSIIGHRAHLGAGAITSNVKSDKSPVCIRCENEKYETDLRKMGALIGDGAEIGAGCVLCPGAIVGRGSRIYPLTRVRGYLPEGCIMKSESKIEKIRTSEN